MLQRGDGVRVATLEVARDSEVLMDQRPPRAQLENFLVDSRGPGVVLRLLGLSRELQQAAHLFLIVPMVPLRGRGRERCPQRRAQDHCREPSRIPDHKPIDPPASDEFVGDQAQEEFKLFIHHGDTEDTEISRRHQGSPCISVDSGVSVVKQGVLPPQVTV